MKFSTTLGLALVSGVQGNAGGSDTCSHVLDTITAMMDRTRHVDAAGGFTFSGIPSTGYVPGVQYTISVSAPGKQLKGFLAYAIDTTNAPADSAARVGTIAAGAGGRPYSCTEGPTATHDSGTGAASKTFLWTAPTGDGPNSISFYGIAYEGNNFWNPTNSFSKDLTQSIDGAGNKICSAGICDCAGMTTCTCTETATCNGADAVTVNCIGSGDCNCGSVTGGCTCAPNVGKCCKESMTGIFVNSKNPLMSTTSDAACASATVPTSEGSTLATSVFSLAAGAVVALAL